MGTDFYSKLVLAIPFDRSVIHVPTGRFETKCTRGHAATGPYCSACGSPTTTKAVTEFSDAFRAMAPEKTTCELLWEDLLWPRTKTVGIVPIGPVSTSDKDDKIGVGMFLASVDDSGYSDDTCAVDIDDLPDLAQSVVEIARRMGIPGEPRLYTVLHVSY